MIHESLFQVLNENELYSLSKQIEGRKNNASAPQPTTIKKELSDVEEGSSLSASSTGSPAHLSDVSSKPRAATLSVRTQEVASIGLKFLADLGKGNKTHGRRATAVFRKQVHSYVVYPTPFRMSLFTPKTVSQ
tara:strand:- start:312 stop:710 length:399 start_codon:yes stop_codon:yes gene_type:complete